MSLSVYRREWEEIPIRTNVRRSYRRSAIPPSTHLVGSLPYTQTVKGRVDAVCRSSLACPFSVVWNGERHHQLTSRPAPSPLAKQILPSLWSSIHLVLCVETLCSVARVRSALYTIDAENLFPVPRDIRDVSIRRVLGSISRPFAPTIGIVYSAQSALSQQPY